MHDNKKSRRLNGSKVIGVTTIISITLIKFRKRTDKSEHVLALLKTEGTHVGTYSSLEISRRRWAM